MRCYDAHNHLQDERLGSAQEVIVQECVRAGVAGMVVNGACAGDWPDVEALARRHPSVVIPSLGWHPWYLHEQEAGWEAEFERWLDRVPGAAVGEIGLDRWILDQPAALRARYAPALAAIEPTPMARQIDSSTFVRKSPTLSAVTTSSCNVRKNTVRGCSFTNSQFSGGKYGQPSLTITPRRLVCFMSAPLNSVFSSAHSKHKYAPGGSGTSSWNLTNFPPLR
jgi:hypothetical protein